MKKALLAAASVLALSVGAQAEVKMGVILGFTGPDRIADARTWLPAPNWR
jgi:hypothetical protein